MRVWSFGRAAAIGGFMAALALAPHAAAASDAVKVIYSFKGGKDGAVPVGPLVQIGGTFYGTTSQGGGTGCGGDGCGIVFSIGPNGGEHIIHKFAGSPDDGATPLAGLVNVGGTLYGTTYDGGENKCGSVHCGTVYSIGTNGAEHVIYNFQGGKDGALPATDLVLIGSVLYGATYAGGGHTGCNTGYTCGTFFSVTAGGNEKVLYDFGGYNAKDGGNPSGSLIEISNRIYGTTEFGGLASCNKTSKEDIGCGTVYSMTTGGGEKVLHEFKGGFDGKLPTEGVIDVGGELFGTAYEGGDGSICGGGCGILYSMSTGGSESVLHSFAAKASDGLEPSGLIFYSNNLYGVTFGGGNQGCNNTRGCGIAYSASTGGHVSVLHDFGSGSGDPEEADSRLIELSHKLYGVSHRGGTGKCSGGPDDSTGCGTVYQLTP
jgi:uncharacterized repeat protein (TIGR03803 family)